MFRMFAYLKTKHNKQDEVDMSDFKVCDEKNFDGNVEEAIPLDAPESRGKEVDLRLYVDSDHAKEKQTRRSRTGYFILLNPAPATWFSKRQSTIETSVLALSLLL
jgi:hypothetical protein